MKKTADSSPKTKAQVAAEFTLDYSNDLAQESGKEVSKGTLNGLEHGIRTQVAGKSVKDGIAEIVHDRGRMAAESAKGGTIEAAKDAAKNFDKIGASVTQDLAFGFAYDKIAETAIPDDLKAKKIELQQERDARAARGELGAKANSFFRGFGGLVLPGGKQIIDGIDNAQAAYALNLDASIKVSENDAKIKAPPTQAEQDAYNKWEQTRKAKLAAAETSPRRSAPTSDAPSIAQAATPVEVSAKLKSRTSQEMHGSHQPSPPKA